jgi:hypothetical protein
MYDVQRAQRRNRIMLVIGLILFTGALSLFVAGYRGLAGWALLISCGANLVSAVVGRRALSRVRASTHQARKG